jgi:dTMP kinase
MAKEGVLAAQFFSFEGIDGCGKSTIMTWFSQWLAGKTILHITTREPGGTLLGENLRNLLLDPSHKKMDPMAEAFLYAASRAQLTREVIQPALDHGTWVLSDRFSDATLAYQGYGRGLDLQRLRRIQDWATGGLWPHHTILLDCDVDIALSRMHNRKGAQDRIEQEKSSFHRRVREGYLQLAELEPNRFIVLNTSRPLDEVIQEFREAILHRLL